MNIGRLAAGREEYYLLQVADGVEDYYLGSGDRPGHWVGTGISGLGLDGEVAADDLRAVLAGRSPQGTRLGRAGRKTPGFDLTFRAPKSVSLLHSLSSPEVRDQVLSGHEEAVGQAVGYLDRHACATRRGAGGRTVVKADGFVAASFRHLTSRAGDPALHTHVLIANLVQADGWWGALDGRLLYAEGKTASYVYQAVLRAELTRRLGVDWQPVRYGMADIAGFDRSVIEAFSTRRRQILDVLDERGERSAAAAQVATLTTRRSKRELAGVDLVAEWRSRAVEQGLTGRVLAGVLGRVDTAKVGVPEVDSAALLGPNGITRRRSSFDRRDVVQAWCQMLAHGADASTVEELTADTLGSPEVERLGASELQAAFLGSLQRRDGRQVPATPFGADRYTTVEMKATEEALVKSAVIRRGGTVAPVEESVVDAALALRPSLGADQREMVRRLTMSGAGVEVVVGKAGAGKTLALDAARAAWQATGTTVIGCSLAARAAAQLESDAGIPSATIARLGRELSRRALPQGAVVVVDEAAMVGTRQLASLAAIADTANAKLVLVGDDRQLPAIDAGGGFRAVMQAVPPIRLDINRRQQAEWERVALDQLASGRTSRALAAYASHGRVTVGANADEVRDLLVDDWLSARQAGGDGPMLALHRSDVEDLNRRARRRLQESGLLGGPELEVAGRRYAVADKVVGRRNDYRAGILNGTRGRIVALHFAEESVTVETDGGEQLRLSRSYLRGGHLDHGYALTVHKAQGATWDRAFVLGDDRLYREAGYVALSRARQHTQLYTVAEDPADEHATYQSVSASSRLERALRSSRQERSVRELSVDGPS